MPESSSSRLSLAAAGFHVLTVSRGFSVPPGLAWLALPAAATQGWELCCGISVSAAPLVLGLGLSKSGGREGVWELGSSPDLAGTG